MVYKRPFSSLKKTIAVHLQAPDMKLFTFIEPAFINTVLNLIYKACIIDFKPGRSLVTDYVSHGKIQGQLA